MRLKETILGIIKRMDFSEAIEQKLDCQRCGGKKTVLRKIAMEKQQKIKGQWYVETCQNEQCDYWDAGFI